MDLHDLFLNFQYVNASCTLFTDFERSALETAVAILQKEHGSKFAKFNFWGKIRTAGVFDYVLLQGINAPLRLDQGNFRTTFYSIDGCVTFKALLPVDQQTVQRCSKIFGLFKGDPKFEYKGQDPPPPALDQYKQWESGPAVEKAPTEDEESKEEDEEVKPQSLEFSLTEEQRLAELILRIDEDTSLIPKGAITLDPLHFPRFEPHFEGLAVNVVTSMASYCHLREVPDIEKKPSYDRDFLKPVSTDAPLGCWSLQYNPATAVATLRNFVWPGFVFYHMSGTKNYGHCYIGNGEKNKDFGFML